MHGASFEASGFASGKTPPAVRSVGGIPRPPPRVPSGRSGCGSAPGVVRAGAAVAPVRDVLALWSGLGYNRRALALRDAARVVASGGWPADLTSLPGVGPYT